MMNETEVILGNSNSRFSGVTSTMLATLPGVSQRVKVAVLGKPFIPPGYQVLKYGEFITSTRGRLAGRRKRVFHARRNDEMIQALVAKKLFGAQLEIVFTSTAQRQHSWFTRWLIGQMDGIISTCNAAASYLEYAPDLIIPHGVDLVEFKPTADRPALWERMGHGGAYGIGMFGRVRPSKGVDLLVRAAIPLLQRDPRPTVLIIGETKAKDKAFQEVLQREIEAAGLAKRILFLGKLPFSQVKEYFQAVSLVTALSRNEGFGLTVLEAMASGCAVVATRAGAWEDVLADFPEALVPEHTVESVSKVLDQMVSQMDLAELGAGNRAYVEQHYSITKEVEALTSYYRRFFIRPSKG